MQYKYIIKPHAARKIWSFYRNVALKYPNTNAEEDVIRNIKKAIRPIRFIETVLLRRPPLLNRWKGMYMAHAGNWYYAYTIDDDTITIRDACHQQNMHDQ